MSEEYCVCSAYEGFGFGEKTMKVNMYQCVIDGNKYPCYYVLMPETKWYDEKNHNAELILREFFWRLRHPFFAYRNMKKRSDKKWLKRTRKN